MRMMSKNIFILLAAGLLLVGCDSRPQMRSKFTDDKPLFMVEEKTGDRFMIEHTTGSNYSVTLLEEGNKSVPQTK